MRKSIPLLVLSLLAAGAALGQNAKLKQGRILMDNLNYVGAIELYNEVLEKHDVAEAKINLAEAYRKVNDTENAEYWYGQVVRLPEAEPIHKLYYGMMLQRNGKCEQAKEWYQQYVEAVPEDMRGQYLARACDYEEELMVRNADIFEVKHLDINSSYDDFGPQYYKGGLVFSSDRDANPMIDRNSQWTGNPFLELFYVDMRQTGTGDDVCGEYLFGRPEKFSNEVNSKFHDAAVSFGKRQKEIYFTRNNFLDGKKGTDDEGVMRLKVYYAESLGEGRWSEAQSLPFNSDEYSVAHPALSPDGERLYFASDMPGGFGGMDLYVSEKEHGRWGPPLNLGPEVNTEGHEIFPFVAADGRLYFASDGHIGLGGLDIFYTKEISPGVYATPENLGYPINTFADDFSIVFNEEGTCGFFASDRAGGAGGDDLYSFKKLSVPVEILVFDANTQEPLAEAKVQLGCKSLTLTTDAEGRAFYDMKVNSCCVFTASFPDYDDNALEACTNNLIPGTPTTLKIPLTRTAEFELEGIVFDDGTGLPLENVVVTLENDCGQPLAEPITTPSSGRYYFKLERECCYKVKAEKQGYLAAWQENICTRGVEETTTFRANLHLQPHTIDLSQVSPENVPPIGGEGNEYTYYDPVTQLWINKADGTPADGEFPDGRKYVKGVLQDGFAPGGVALSDTSSAKQPLPYLLHIYYDFDEASIREDAIPELEKLYKTMIENPDIIVEIGSHTDARGGSYYNLRLSQRRAESVVRWLTKRGIPRNRLVPRGYGETVPVNNCVNNVPCSERDHQLNRRTEFKVVGCISCIDPAKALISRQPEEVKVDECKACPF